MEVFDLFSFPADNKLSSVLGRYTSMNFDLVYLIDN